MPNANLPCHADLVVSSSPANASSPFPDDDPTRRLATLLTGIYTVAETPETSETLTHLDTADWRLRGAGIDLIWTVGTRELIAFGPDDRTTVQLLGAARWPALIDKIPEGAVRDLVARPVSIRALLPFAVSRARSTGFAVLNSDDKTVARARWWDVRVESPVERRLPARVEVEHFRGYEDEAGEIEHLLTAGSTLSRATGTWLDAFRAVPGIGPAKTQRFGMHADQAADLAVADALLGHLSIMEATVDGIIADLDTEFLHDFRVSVRRTRSVLKLLGDVLPEGTAAKTAVEFRWLGDATTPTRDLDVYLLELRRARRVRESAARPPTVRRSPPPTAGGGTTRLGPSSAVGPIRQPGPKLACRTRGDDRRTATFGADRRKNWPTFACTGRSAR